MKITIAGGTGFIGEPLAAELRQLGDVVVLSRDPSKVRSGRGVQWDPAKPDSTWKSEVADADVVVNLAGENVGKGRWTTARKQRLAASRLEPTRALTEVIRASRKSNRVLVNASAVGYYGSRGSDVLTEESAPGSDFLAELCKQWEAAAHQAEEAARVVILRFGVVLGPDGGALQKMALPFRLFVGGPLGSGDQWLSWVDRRDVIRAVRWVIDHGDARGVFNTTAPNPVTNREFSKKLGAALHRPSLLPTPAPALRIALGEMADSMLLASQRAVPRKLQERRFSFEYPEVQQSLDQALGKK